MLTRLCLSASLAAIALAEDPCSGLDTSPWVSPAWKSTGYHVLCFGQAACGGEGEETCSADALVPITVYWGGLESEKAEFSAKRPATLLEAEEMLIDKSKLSNEVRHNRIKKAISKKKAYKGIFGFYGVRQPDSVPPRIKSAGELFGLVLVFEGGFFLWPGIEKGFERKINFVPLKAKKDEAKADAQELNIKMITMSLAPLVVEVSEFLNVEQREHVIEKAKPHMANSPVSHMDHDVGKPDTNWRSSDQHFLPASTPLLRGIEAQVSGLMSVPMSHQEHLQVLRYQKQQRYAAHHDYFDPAMYENNKDIMALTKNGLFNRMATVFFYFSDVEEGGQTSFPRAGGLPQPANFEACDKGVNVDPKAGRIVIFYSTKPDASFDPLSLHGGCAVVNGTKWSANKWIWNKPMSFVQD